MKHFSVLFLFMLFVTHSLAQKITTTYKSGLNHLNKITRLIKENNAAALSELVSYPLKQPNPIPDINTRKEFIAIYPMLFDKVFKQKLASTHFNQTNTIDRYDGFGILNGDIWLNEAGKIIAFNHISPGEQELMDKLTREIKQKMPKEIAAWKRNILVCETPKFLVRIDLMENDSLRYISWSKPKTIADEPDIMLLNGVIESQGTMGGVTYTFKNKEWTYIVDRVFMAETREQEGMFLRLSNGDKEIGRYKCREIK